MVVVVAVAVAAIAEVAMLVKLTVAPITNQLTLPNPYTKTVKLSAESTFTTFHQITILLSVTTHTCI